MARGLAYWVFAIAAAGCAPRAPSSPVPAVAARATFRCPDGTALPCLNGVPAAPALARSPHLGPLPPVRRVIEDQTGCQWYEHADGSVTTTRFCEVVADGVARREVETVHAARLPDRAGVERGPKARTP